MRSSPLPLLVFAGIDLILALILLINDGFTGAFFLIAAIGLVLAALGLNALRRKPSSAGEQQHDGRGDGDPLTGG